MSHTQTASPAHSSDHTSESSRGTGHANGQRNGHSTGLSGANLSITPPCLCEPCRQSVLEWLRHYEREIQTQAQVKKGRNGYLTLALAKHVAQHLRQLRRSLAKGPGSIVALAKEMFEATEVNATCD